MSDVHIRLPYVTWGVIVIVSRHPEVISVILCMPSYASSVSAFAHCVVHLSTDIYGTVCRLVAVTAHSSATVQYDNTVCCMRRHRHWTPLWPLWGALDAALPGWRTYYNSNWHPTIHCALLELRILYSVRCIKYLFLPGMYKRQSRSSSDRPMVLPYQVSLLILYNTVFVLSEFANSTSRYSMCEAQSTHPLWSSYPIFFYKYMQGDQVVIGRLRCI
jgi:hypothetical protein